MKSFQAHWDELGQFAVLHPVTQEPPVCCEDGFQGGAFCVPSATDPTGELRVLISNHEWEHASVSLIDRCPSWAEMCQIKNLFWGDDEWCVQYHPASTDYVNLSETCLHIWRPLNDKMPCPPTWMVGPKDGESHKDCINAGMKALKAEIEALEGK